MYRSGRLGFLGQCSVFLQSEGGKCRKLNSFYPENQQAKSLLLIHTVCIAGDFKTAPLFISAYTHSLLPFHFLDQGGNGDDHDARFSLFHNEGFLQLWILDVTNCDNYS